MLYAYDGAPSQERGVGKLLPRTRAAMALPAQHRRLHQMALGLGVRAGAASAEDEEDDSWLPTIPWAEIMQHRFLDDIWVVVDGKVYDMTEFIAQEVHPGGEEIPLQYAGKVRRPPGRRSPD